MICIVCEPSNHANDTHGLCLKHLRECLEHTYRRRQLKEGNFDCFGKATDYCDQGNCKYRKLCVEKA